MSALRACCDELLAASPVGLSVLLPGPTGERNTYTLRPREAVLCVAADRIDLLHALGFVLAADARAVWFDDEEARAALAELPAPLRRRVKLVADAMAVPLDAALIHGDAAAVAALSVSLARRGGAIVSLQAAPAGARGGRTFVIERLLAERSVSVNTAAAGGNASLMTIG
jgi:RHH-type transcriptional regulator, proline utilization regulon repressor / proline dehydrogenase / delta 1-pyrroline-5-carboxylate dehydrogenase